MLNPTAEPRREESAKTNALAASWRNRGRIGVKLFVEKLKDENFKHEIISAQGIYGYVFML